MSLFLPNSVQSGPMFTPKIARISLGFLTRTLFS